MPKNRTESKKQRIYNGIFKRRAINYSALVKWSSGVRNVSADDIVNKDTSRGKRHNAGTADVVDTADVSDGSGDKGTYDEAYCYNYLYREFLRRTSVISLTPTYKKIISQIKPIILEDIRGFNPEEETTWSIESLKGKRLKIYNYFVKDNEICVDVEFAGGYEDTFCVPFL